MDDRWLAWRTELFVAHALFGGPDAVSPWDWECWQQIEAELGSLVTLSRGPANVEVLQHRRVAPGTRVLTKDYLKFGRLGWGADSSTKWAHGSPVTRDRSADWNFVDLTLWAPSRGACGRQDRPPTVWINLRPGVPGVFASKLMIVMSASIADTPECGLDERVRAVRDVIGAELWVTTRRPFDVVGPSGESLSFNFHTAGPRLKGPRTSLSLGIVGDGWSVVE